MLSTLQALLVAILALLPGALYTWSFEQQVGPWGIGLSDRLYRFVGSSAVLHAVLAPATYELWRRYVQTGVVGEGRALPWWLWLVVGAYVALPLLAGRVIGVATWRREPWVRFIVGRAPAPRAWDHVFSSQGFEAWVRVKLTDGGWVGGAYAKGPGTLASYAAGYVEERDLFLAWTAPVDQTTGEFEADDAGLPQLQPAGVLIRWSEIAYCLIEETDPQ